MTAPGTGGNAGSDATHPIDRLQRRVFSIPHDSYPPDVIPIPAPIRGTVAFAGGAGLIVRDHELPLPGFPVGGVMFIGDNVDASEPFYDRLRGRRPHGGPGEGPLMPTWRNLYDLFRDAGISDEEVFFTNAYLGLVKGSDPTRDHSGETDPEFRRLCAEVLAEQVAIMQPRLIATLGLAALNFVGTAYEDERLQPWNVKRMKDVTTTANTLLPEVLIGGHQTRAVALYHPSLIHASSRNRTWGEHTGYDAEVALLQEAARR